ncbi:peptidase S41, partial [Flavobacterium sp. IR1]
EGMLDTLDDPYSVYMDQETANQFVESLGSSFEGIGAEVSMTDGTVTIVAPFRESPAEQAGLQPNDKIIEIDGESTDGLSLYEAVLKIRGEKGTTVTLTVDRAGASEFLTIPVVRDDIPIETVRVSTIERYGKTIGMLDITSFSVDTAERFEEGLAVLEAQGIDGLLIEVRGNPGGYLDSGEKIGTLIIPGGEPIVQ